MAALQKDVYVSIKTPPRRRGFRFEEEARPPSNETEDKFAGPPVHDVWRDRDFKAIVGENECGPLLKLATQGRGTPEK